MLPIGLNGILASFICSTAFYPIDTIKVRLQGKKPIFNKGLFKGIKMRYASSTIQAGTFWTVYEETKKTNNTVKASAYASFISGLVETPFDFSKRRHQLCNKKFTFLTLSQYAGLNIISSMSQMTTYYSLCDEIDQIYAGLITSIISYPIDTLKTMSLTKKIPPLSNLTYGYLFKIIYITSYLNLNSKIMEFMI